MSLVNGYRIKCQNYKRMAEREKEMRRREERLGSWSQEKASRKAAIKQFRNKLRRGPATSDSQTDLVRSESAYSSNWTEEESYKPRKKSFSDLNQDNKEDQGSMNDLRDSKKRKSLKNCCSCSIM